MDLHSRYFWTQMVGPVQFYILVIALVYDLDNALLWTFYNYEKFVKQI